jgi:hypothetical protein
MAGINWFHVGFVAPLLSIIVILNALGILLPWWFLLFLIILILGMVSYHGNKIYSEWKNPVN